jgi:NADH dehydrogenase [ubiquinone] 1 alpha subcomplex assembly factor 7
MSEDLPTLEAEVRRRLLTAGPMPVGQYMQMCLTHAKHGYYMRRDPFGATGDFVTAPEITQMFGELIGLWACSVWRQMGAPDSVRMVELGPGRGTMLIDALRAVQIVPAFRKAIVLHLVEVSPALEQRQRQNLAGFDVPAHWHKTLEEVPGGAAIILANEFFDSLPVQQAVLCADGWHERVVRFDNNENFQFGHAREPMPLFDQMLPENMRHARVGDVFEWRSDQIALELGRRVDRSRGAALVIDYGHSQSAVGDTLQAVRNHEFVDPLAAPGLADLTSHVDFQALAHAAESMGARSFGPVEQGAFLRRLGIINRADTLKKAAPPQMVADIDVAVDRLTSDAHTGMGRMFKAVGFAHPNLGPLPGF